MVLDAWLRVAIADVANALVSSAPKEQLSRCKGQGKGDNSCGDGDYIYYYSKRRNEVSQELARQNNESLLSRNPVTSIRSANTGSKIKAEQHSHPPRIKACGSIVARFGGYVVPACLRSILGAGAKRKELRQTSWNL
jgi:hypothetical protein